jgi:hypothetical protein
MDWAVARMGIVTRNIRRGRSRVFAVLAFYYFIEI